MNEEKILALIESMHKDLEDIHKDLADMHQRFDEMNKRFDEVHSSLKNIPNQLRRVGSFSCHVVCHGYMAGTCGNRTHLCSY